MSKQPTRSNFKKRPYTPQKTFKSKIEAAIYEVTNEFFRTKAFKHAATKGGERENPIIDFFENNLPDIYSVVKGEVVDIKGQSSRQLDVMIYDSSRNIPFYSSDNYILPAEALLAGIEVKSKLTKGEIRKILISAQSLKNLKPFGKKSDISKRQRRVEEKVQCRYFYSVFAYETDTSKQDWAKKEYARLEEVAKEEKIDPTIIDRICVLDRGLMNVTNMVARETDDNSSSFLYFYMGVLNFILRENHRRSSVPYLDYAGKLSEGWKKIK